MTWSTTRPLAFNRSDDISIANPISGTGALSKLGGGTTTLTGANSYSGTTTILAGTLQIGDGGTSGTLGTGSVVNNAILALNRSDAVTIANAISGTGALNHVGSGTTTLTGISTYGGATSVTDGILLVDGSIAGSSGLTVASGATVGGTGVLPSTTIAAGGFLAPGNAAIGTLTVGGSLTLAPGATTIIRVNGAASDRLNVAGTANLSGNLQVVAQSASFNTPYTIVNATGGLSGTFTGNSVSGALGAGITPTLTYDANNAYLPWRPTRSAPSSATARPRSRRWLKASTAQWQAARMFLPSSRSTTCRLAPCRRP